MILTDNLKIYLIKFNNNISIQFYDNKYIKFFFHNIDFKALLL